MRFYLFGECFVANIPFAIVTHYNIYQYMKWEQIDNKFSINFYFHCELSMHLMNMPIKQSLVNILACMCTSYQSLITRVLFYLMLENAYWRPSFEYSHKQLQNDI